MKKVIILALLLVIGFSAQSATIDRMWTSVLTPAPFLTGTEVAGEGAGWYAEVFNVTDGLAAGGGNTISTFGWIVGYGYAINNFNFGPATETDSVFLRLYNNAIPGSAGFYVDSATHILTDIVDDVNPPAADDLKVTFNFTSSSWQAVPEPATALLFGIGGMGAFVLRRNKLKAKEEADA